MGEVRGEEKRDLLAAADVLVVPSRRLADGREEGTPTVILEALAAGLPVVATRTGGIADVLTPEKNGLLVEPAVASLAKALSRLVDPALGPSLLRRLAEASEPDRHDWRRVGPVLATSLIAG